MTALGAHLLETGKVDAVLHVRASTVDPVETDAIVSRTRDEVISGSQSRYGPAAPLVHVHRLLDEGVRFAVLAKPCDIAAIRNLASYGVQFDAGFLNTLVAAYTRTAQDAIAAYNDDALLNGLAFDRHEEELAVETFSKALSAAGLGFVRDPMGLPQIPNWNRVIAALPGFHDELREAIESDAADSA